MPLAEDGIRPIYTGVARLKNYGKGDDVHVCKNKRPHLLFLTPDALQIFTTSDAEYGYENLGKPASGALDYQHSGRFLGKLVRIKEQDDQRGGDQNSGDNSQGDADPEDLAEGQVFRLGIALNQILGLQPYKEDQLIIWYQPNKPSKKGIVEEQTLTVLRGLWGAVEAVAKWDMSAGTSSSTRPPPPQPGAHHFTIKLSDSAEVRVVKEAVELAQRKFALAIIWLSEGLPLEPESSLVMVTVGGRNGGSAYTIPLPQWDVELTLPIEASQALASSNSRKALNTVVSVYLSTPLGVAVAEIPLLRLQQSAAEGNSPFGVLATLQTPQDDEDSKKDPKRPEKRWMVTLSWKARRGELLNNISNNNTGGGDGSVSISSVNASTSSEIASSAGGWSGEGSGITKTLRGRSASPSKASTYAAAGGSNIVTSGGSTASVSSSREIATRPTHGNNAHQDAGMVVLIGLAALSGLAAIARRVRGQLARLRGPPQIAGLSDQSAPAQCYRWYITFLDLDIDEETVTHAPASPPVKRSISVSVGHGVGVPPGVSGGAPLPYHIQLLVEQYPDILTQDIARRFIVGLDSETKAFSALSSMAKWTTENKLNEILRRPQPAFTVMKRHYPHGFPGWSTKKDCLVEIECMGSWPAAYNAIAAEGVTEQQMLEHLLFTYQYAFGVLDNRPLPNGKTVKIVDLGGLGMSDLKTPGFKLITRVGAMLSLNFPQRLHQCFLINAPGWWAVAWKLISPLIPPKVRKQMMLFSRNDLENATKAMLEWVDEDVLPIKYGGKNPLPLQECAFEVDMAKYVENLNRGMSTEIGVEQQQQQG